VQLIGQPEEEAVVHEPSVRGVEPEAVDVILLDQQVAGVDEHVLHQWTAGRHAVPPRRRLAIEVQPPCEVVR
jgi:DNA-binding transcriptional regulator YdaS (Cro superfamily)